MESIRNPVTKEILLQYIFEKSFMTRGICTTYRYTFTK